MDFELPAEDDPRRVVVREWLEANPQPTGKQLADAGYVVPHWPAPWGLGADPIHQLIIDDEFKRAEVSGPSNAIGIGWAAPTILTGGTQEQIDRYLPKIFSGEEVWCQLFSEPDAGSDLANLATRAVRDGDEYVINGSKIWSSGAHGSKYGILIARTDPDVSKHKGISYFICPMDTPGLTMSPIIDMTTAHSFNQVFFDDMRLPAENLVGAEGDGWRLAKVTLANERVSLSSAGSLWGVGPSTYDLIDMIRPLGITDPVMRQRIAGLYAEAEVLRLMRLRTLTAKISGQAPGAEASVQKMFADEHGQHVMELAKDIAGSAGMLEGSGPEGKLPRTALGTPTGKFEQTFDQFPNVEAMWHYGYCFAPALTLGGGTFAIQRNIVAEVALGLPRDLNVERGKTWAETRG